MEIKRIILGTKVDIRYGPGALEKSASELYEFSNGDGTAYYRVSGEWPKFSLPFNGFVSLEEAEEIIERGKINPGSPNRVEIITPKERPF